MNYRKPWLATAALLCVAASGCASDSSSSTSSSTSSEPATTTASKATSALPSSVIDLTYWNITVPVDVNNDSKPDTVKIPQISQYQHSDFFYVNADNNVVFASPNKALTTANSSNTRSELRHMSRGTNRKIKTKEYGNNFSVLAHPYSDKFAAVGGKLEATLSVNHVAINAGHPEKFPAYSAVVGQIHGVKDKEPLEGGGWGNEPIKIYYKKWPNHETGSVDIAYPVWGNTWESTLNPEDKGISLNEEFSYTINVHENIMHLTFENARQGTVKYSIDLSNNVDANGAVDEKDNPLGYTKDQLYFKAGIYNQCSTSDKEGFWYAACPGTGVWSFWQSPFFMFTILMGSGR